MDHSKLIVPPGKRISLADYDPAFTGEFKRKQDAREKLARDVKRLATYQEVLYADNSCALLIIFQALDAAGKDSTIKHVMSGVNPQGCQVFSFKAPSAEELDHDYLWRCVRALPERGRIGIFNRSYYEEVLVVRVHPELLDAQRLPPEARQASVWQDRFQDIVNFERYLVRNGILLLKFFLHVSREEQRQRFLERMARPEKHWKFSARDVRERACWEDYMQAYEDVLNHTSTAWAPWYVIPADHKWFTRVAVADVIIEKLKSLNLQYPTLSAEQEGELLEAHKMLEAEGAHRHPTSKDADTIPATASDAKIGNA
jgi:PPK2 family polyphosphate:nucleotide phosphotransferase